MSKVIDSATLASITSGRMAGVVLARLHFTPILRFANSFQNIYWDEDGGGEKEYLGVGNLASISTLGETGELAAQTIQLTLSGIPASIITDIFSDEYISQPLYLWYATLDKDTYAVESGTNGPVLIFAGSMDYGNIEFGETASVTVNATSRLADWDRPRGGRFNHSYQQTHVDSTDEAFSYMQALQDLPISWGGRTVADGGLLTGGRRGGGGGGGGGPGGPGQQRH